MDHRERARALKLAELESLGRLIELEYGEQRGGELLDRVIDVALELARCNGRRPRGQH